MRAMFKRTFSARPSKRPSGPDKTRIAFWIFIALLLPFSQAANFAHVIVDDHEIDYHGHSHQSDFHHSDTDGQHSHSTIADRHQGDLASNSDQSKDHQHHTATDHLEFSQVLKPSPQLFTISLVVVLLGRFEIFCTNPQGINWPRVTKQHWRCLSSGPPPQLRAPPSIS